LVHGGVALAVLPSIWPEAYALVVDECLASGVPVVAFDLGAVGERLKAWDTRTLVSLNEGADGLARTVLDCLENPRTVSRAVIERLPTPEDAAGQHIALYRRLVSG
jgi:glycosyltransferase involved in cell wall biosynthesis